MANLKLNLIPRKGAREVLSSRLFDKIKRGSFVFLGIYLLILLLLFAWRFTMSSSIKKLKNEISDISAKVEVGQLIESQQLLIKNKLRLSRQVLVKQQSWSLLLKDVSELIPNSLAVKSVRLSDIGNFEVTVTTNQLQELAVMVRSLREIGIQKDFIKNVYLESLEKASDGSYGFILVFET